MLRRTIFLVFLALLVGCANPPPPTTPAVTLTPPDPTLTPAITTAPSPDSAYLPNPEWQPGATNPDVMQSTIQTTICVSGYSSSVRPPVSYTDALKKQQIPQYGYSDTNLADYEEDHLISLELGGDPRDAHNLWPQPRYTTPWNASNKDTLENVLHQMVCSGQLTLDAARKAIATDWVAAYKQYVPQSIFALTPVPPEP